MSGNAAAPNPRQFVVKPAPRVLSVSGNAVSNRDDDDQPVLMEARLVEMISSLRHLIRSNQQLDEALRECHDDDLLRALEENEGVILRRRDDARVLAAKLRGHGVNVSLEDKIPPYEGSSVLRRIKEKQQEKSQQGGMYL